MSIPRIGKVSSTFLFVAVIAGSFGAQSLCATYSIVACDPKTRECGVAVQTNNLAVGASVPYAQAGVGAIVSQFETNPNYGPRGLALLAKGRNPTEVLEQLLREDGNFEGAGPESRQVAVVSLDGRVAVHSGEEVMRTEWAGSRNGQGYSVQGNGLVGTQVLEAMEQIFLKTQGTLAERLLAALSAGDAAGGQKTGRESAALLVKTMDGWPVDIDLRVDHSADPVADLRVLLNMQLARQQIGQARRAARDGRLNEARAMLIRAVARASGWSRIWLQAAQVAANIEEPELALQYLNVAFSQNPAWSEAEIGDGNYAELGRFALFHQWVSSQQESGAMDSYEKLSKSSKSSTEEKLDTARKLMEVGRFKEARLALEAASKANDESANVHSLLAEVAAGEGNYDQALSECNAALKIAPGNALLAAKLRNLQREASTHAATAGGASPAPTNK